MTSEPDHQEAAASAAEWPDDEIVHPIQPYQAKKTYICPGCETPIDPGVGHVVVVPIDAADLRRHWHRGCWHKERRQRG